MQSKDLVKISTSLIPPKWQEKYILKRIDEEDMEISLDTRNAIIESMKKGSSFIQLGKSTIMVKTIRSIEPKWGEANIPPRPREQLEIVSTDEQTATARTRVVNQNEIDEWDKIFKDQL